MGKAGILTKGDGIELLDGELFCKYGPVGVGGSRWMNTTRWQRSASWRRTSGVELLAGEIFTMAAMGNRHLFCIRWLNKELVIAVGDSAVVDPQLPVLLNQGSEPEPDFAILRWRDDHYRESAKGGPEDVLLVIEVSGHYRRL